MAPGEYLDILDEEGNKTGELVSHKEAHTKGVLHRVVHVWIVNSKGELLLQKRAGTKTSWPNSWDISVAGHISAGEKSVTSAIRETKEEIGLQCPATAFELLFTVRNHEVTNEGAYIANEFQDVYLVHCDREISDFIFTDAEVSQVQWISVPKLKEWIVGKGEKLVPHDKEYKQLFDVLAK